MLFILVTLAISSCKLQRTSLSNNQHSWKEDWVSMLLDKYTDYKFQFPSICPNDKREFYYDFARKIQSIREYPFESVLQSLRNYVKANNIQFDTMKMINISQSYAETIDYSCPATYAVFIKSSICEVVSVDLNFCEKVSFIGKLNDPIFIKKTLLNKFVNSCDFGYVSYTTFDKRWNWSIENIIINPQGTAPTGD